MEEKIIELFKKCTNSHVSGEELSKKLGVSRTSIWKHMENLRKLGYDIEATPHLGYRLLETPDKFLPHEISWELGTKLIGKMIHSFKSTKSTNDLAYKMAEEGAAEGTCVFAEEQTKGKGRMSRLWVSEKGGIYVSIILKPKMLPSETPKITLVAAVAVANALRRSTGLDFLIKWPNDIYINGKKACGILTEMKAEQDTTQFLIIGIGVNVNQDKKHLPPHATSVSLELGKQIFKVDLAKKILKEIEKQYLLFKKQGFKPIKTEWRDLSAVLGKRVKITSLKGVIEGQAQDIDDTGALVVRLDNGFLEKIFAGDVLLARKG